MALGARNPQAILTSTRRSIRNEKICLEVVKLILPPLVLRAEPANEQCSQYQITVVEAWPLFLVGEQWQSQHHRR